MSQRNAKAVIVTDDGDWERWPPGGVMLTYDHGAPEGSPPTGIQFACPCGCGQVGGLSFAPQRWTVEGEWPDVTVNPSIGFYGQNRDGGFHWHGHLRRGVFEEC